MLDTLNKEIALEIFNKANENYGELHNKKNIMVRWGQTLWNTAEDYVKEHGTDRLIDCFQNLRGTDKDCFYSDEKTQKFFEQLEVLGK